MCEAIDPKAATRQIKSYDAEHVFPGGAVVEHDDRIWIGVDYGRRVPAGSV